ncbi:MAG TPA: hypothetical protein VKZ89_01755 [Thermobifida alba]|nr:hypothetical protein [Thermobifida alba]
MTDPAASLYRTGRRHGTRTAIRAAVEYLRAAGHLEAARLLETDTDQVADAALADRGRTRDRFSSWYAGAEARAEQATRERTRAERAAGAGLDPEGEQ